ncbi:hypothetical protein PS918_00457 [Pseudomonas fluorescens]|uniref:Uncharacterized protein n=1 Tax=Pseudomonas fluorescens TaxID=294 RepID=A0A5E7QXQ9_PSEFL|nr:DUF6555 family protein [Pseudomonas fluorescens]VVP66821.1 hypothetical protein PS918_00457 [Pseudomonas fluorescens]
MSELVTYAVHYVFEGVRQHFFKLAVKFSDGEAIHSAAIHAFPQRNHSMCPDISLEIAREQAQQLGITQIRWNEAV